MGRWRGLLADERHVGFFRTRVGANQTQAADTDPSHWLQRWIAIAIALGISKQSLLTGYYMDEFLLVLDSYNDMHKIDKDKPKKDTVRFVSAESW